MEELDQESFPKAQGNKLPRNAIESAKETRKDQKGPAWKCFLHNLNSEKKYLNPTEKV